MTEYEFRQQVAIAIAPVITKIYLIEKNKSFPIPSDKSVSLSIGYMIENIVKSIDI